MTKFISSLNFKNVAIFGTIIAIVIMFAAAMSPKPAHALSAPLPRVDSFSVQCGTAATRIVGDGVSAGGYNSLYCENISTEPVAWGDSALTTSTAPLVCNDTACVRASFSADAKQMYCRAAVATTIKCIAGL